MSISFDGSTDANRLLQLAESLAGLGHWRADNGISLFIWSPEVYRILGFSPDKIFST